MSWTDTYVHRLRELATFGEPVVLRAGPAREILESRVWCVPEGWQNIRGRGGSAQFARLEQLYYLAGEEPRGLAKIVPAYDGYCKRNGRYPDAYGPRLRIPLQVVVQELATRPTSTRAVAMVWTSEDIWRALQDRSQDWPVPCTVALQFLVRRGGVVVHAYMRSCDAWLGLYYDAPAFAFLGRCVAAALGRRFDRLLMDFGSLHLYERHIPPLLAMGRRPDTTELVQPLRDDVIDLDPHDPPCGPHEARVRWRGLVYWAHKEVRTWEES